jgi:hypothetical protein
VFDCVRAAGGLEESGARDAGLGVDVASLMKRGLANPRARFRAASVRCLETGVHLCWVLPTGCSRVPAADGPAPRSGDRRAIGRGQSAGSRGRSGVTSCG